MTSCADIDMIHRTEKIQETFLGRKVKDVCLVVLTPLQNAYNDLYSMLNCRRDISYGFYRNASFSVGKRRGILVCGPQGAAAQDVIYLFPSAKIFFFGYAGSLIEDIPIGTIVEVVEIMDESGDLYPLTSLNVFRSVKGAYSPCFLGEVAEMACSQARQRGGEVVDMETVYCAKAAVKNNNSFSAWLLVTDIPGIMDVCSVGKKVKDKIEAERYQALEVIRRIVLTI